MFELDKEYREWFIDQLNVIDGLDYGPLLCELFDVEFYSLVKYDEDRGADGMALRDVWAKEIGYRDRFDFGPPKLLEVLVGIAKRIEFQIFGSQYIDEWDYVKIFWDLIWNLGLKDMHGDLSKRDCDTFLERCDTFLERCDKNVTLFCIKNDHRDMRKLPLWTQMGLYVNEKWPNL